MERRISPDTCQDAEALLAGFSFHGFCDVKRYYTIDPVLDNPANHSTICKNSNQKLFSNIANIINFDQQNQS